MTNLLDFLAQRRIAIVGVSHDPDDFSRQILREFREREYDVVPVNPGYHDIDRLDCYARVADIQPPVDGALLMTSPAVTDSVVRECVAAGIPRIWMYRRSDPAVAFCESHGVAVVAGECPLMYLSETGWIHRLHGWLHHMGAS
jgi:predicted CoA-binding protein